jgi:hypothetical protein
VYTTFKLLILLVQIASTIWLILLFGAAMAPLVKHKLSFNRITISITIVSIAVLATVEVIPLNARLRVIGLVTAVFTLLFSDPFQPRADVSQRQVNITKALLGFFALGMLVFVAYNPIFVLQ